MCCESGKIITQGMKEKVPCNTCCWTDRILYQMIPCKKNEAKMCQWLFCFPTQSLGVCCRLQLLDYCLESIKAICTHSARQNTLGSDSLFVKTVCLFGLLIKSHIDFRSLQLATIFFFFFFMNWMKDVEGVKTLCMQCTDAIWSW